MGASHDARIRYNALALILPATRGQRLTGGEGEGGGGGRYKPKQRMQTHSSRVKQPIAGQADKHGGLMLGTQTIAISGQRLNM